MEQKKRKLHNSRGASLLMALLVVLVVMMVSVVILSAASANAGRLKRNQAEEQAYLTVSSAARLMRDSIADENVVYILNTTVVTQYTDDEGNPHTSKDDQGATPVADTLPFGTVINSLMDGVTKNTAKRSFVIAAPNMGDVQVDAVMSTMDKDMYSITALLYLAGQPASNCCVQLIFEGKHNTISTTTENTTTTVESVKWETHTMEKGEMPTPTATPAP